MIQTIQNARPGAIEFVQREISAAYFPAGFEASDPWSKASGGPRPVESQVQ